MSVWLSRTLFVAVRADGACCRLSDQRDWRVPQWLPPHVSLAYSSDTTDGCGFVSCALAIGASA